MTKAALFPGQGSQAVGMGKTLYEAFPCARDVFEEVDGALNQHLTRLIFDGPLEDLTLTENAQAALMTVSMAALAVLKREFDRDITLFQVTAGHSLGEYTALAAAGVISLSDTARLLKIRGRAMQQAVPQGEGSMVAVLGLTAAECQQIAEEASSPGSLCVLANDNAPGQAVLSGTNEAVQRAIVIAQEKGARKCILLPVSAPFHSPLMAPAADAMAEALTSVTFLAPKIPVIVNVTADYVRDPDVFKEKLVEQVTGQVRWTDTLLRMGRDGVTEIVEIGAGKVLTGLTKRILPEAAALSLGTPQDIEDYVQKL